MNFPTIESQVGNTPLVRLQRLNRAPGNTVLVKLEGNNPAGSVKDRPALSMIKHAEARGEIKPGDRLIERSGNCFAENVTHFIHLLPVDDCAGASGFCITRTLQSKPNLSCSNGHQGISSVLVSDQGNQTVADLPDAGQQLGVFHADQAKGQRTDFHLSADFLQRDDVP